MYPGPENSPVWPRVDMFVTERGEFGIEIELSGMKSENLEITVQDSLLEVKGARPELTRANCSELVTKEIPRGPFVRVVKVPSDFDLTKATAAYLNGFLRITGPRRVR